jgi:hypothetical protein
LEISASFSLASWKLDLDVFLTILTWMGGCLINLCEAISYFCQITAIAAATRASIYGLLPYTAAGM